MDKEVFQQQSEDKIPSHQPQTVVSQLFETFFNRLDEAVVVIDDDEKICFLNRAALKLTSFSLMQCIGKDFNYLEGQAKSGKRPFFLQPGDGVAVDIDLISLPLDGISYTVAIAQPIYATPVQVSSQDEFSILDNGNAGFLHLTAGDALSKHQSEELCVLEDVARACAEAADEDSLIEYITRRAGERLFRYNFGVLLVDDARRYLYEHYTYSYSDTVKDDIWKTPLGQGISGKSALSGEPHRAGDVCLDADYIQIDQNTRSELCVPIKCGENVLGVIDAESPELNAFSAADENLLLAIAQQLAAAISRIRLANAVRRYSREAEMVRQASASLVSTADLEENLDRFLDSLMQVIQYDQAILLVNDGDDLIRIAAGKSSNACRIPLGRVFDQSSRLFRILNTSDMPMRTGWQPELLEEIYQHKAVPTSFILLVPLMLRGKKTGDLVLVRHNMPDFSARDTALAENFASQAALAVEHSQLFKSSNRLSREMEALTGVSMALRNASSMKEMVSNLIKDIVDLFNASAMTIFLFERDLLELVGAYGRGEQFIHSYFPYIEDELIWRIIYSGEILINPAEIEKEKLRKSYIYQMTISENGDLLGGAIVPLKSTSTVIGLMHIALPTERQLSKDDYRLIFSITDIIANAIYRNMIMETLEQRVSQRITQLSTLFSISSIASEHRPLTQLFEDILEELLDAMGSDTGIILLLDEDKKHLHMAVQKGVPGQICDLLEEFPLEGESWSWSEWLLEKPDPLVSSDLLTDERLPKELHVMGNPAIIAIPIRLNRQTLGLLSVMKGSLDKFSAEDLGLISMIGEQIGATIENTRLRKQAEEVAVMEERQRLARELHDSVTQTLYSVSLMANGARKLARTQKWERCLHYLDELSNTAQEALKEMRLLIYQLRPSALEQEGLHEALRQRLEGVERRAGMRTFLSGELPYKLSPEVEEGLYRIVMEALNNVLKHARATYVTINIQQEECKTAIEICDDGEGFDPECSQAKTGIGITSMRERAEKLGGILSIKSRQGEGTQIKVIV